MRLLLPHEDAHLDDDTEQAALPTRSLVIKKICACGECIELHHVFEWREVKHETAFRKPVLMTRAALRTTSGSAATWAMTAIAGTVAGIAKIGGTLARANRLSVFATEQTVLKVCANLSALSVISLTHIVTVMVS